MELWTQLIGGVVSLLVASLIGGVAYIRALRKQVHELEKKCENLATKDGLKDLELKMKDLERTDALQQQTLNQLPELIPLIKKVLDVVEKEQRP